jgi:hypothetical protein
MQAAARLDDLIAHTSAMEGLMAGAKAGLLIGLVVGAGLALGAALVIGTGGLAAEAIFGGALLTGGALGRLDRRVRRAALILQQDRRQDRHRLAQRLRQFQTPGPRPNRHRRM